MPQQWFIGVYFCPGGTTERSCDYQVKSRDSIIKHIEKHHNLHYSWFGGNRKEFQCEKCSASSSDIVVIKDHVTKVHKLAPNRIKQVTNQTAHFDRNKSSSSPKARKRLNLDSDTAYGRNVSCSRIKSYGSSTTRGVDFQSLDIIQDTA